MYHMTMLQERAVQMIQDMSDDNVGFLIEVMQSWKQQEGKNMVVLIDTNVITQTSHINFSCVP